MEHRTRMRALAWVTVAALALAGCQQSATVPTAATPDLLPVSAAAPQAGRIEQVTAFTGRVMPEGAVYIIPKVAGEVTKVNFEIGDTVKKGDVLFELDDTIDQLQLKQAQAALDSAKAGLAQATGATFEAQLLQMEGQLKQAQSQKKWTEDSYDIYDDSYSANANSMDRRVRMARTAMDAAKKALDDAKANNASAEEIQQLSEAHQNAKIMYNEAANALDDFSGGYETQYNQLTQGLEQIEIGLDIAEKAYDLAKGDVHKEQLKSIEAQLGQAQVGYELAMQKLSYSKVTSPIAGVVQQKGVSLHGMATQQQPSYVISDNGALTISFGVPANIAANLNIGDLVSVESSVKHYQAPIVEIAGMIDQTSGLFTIKANLTEAAPELLSGVAIKLTAVTAKSENALLIPAGAIYYDDGKPFVFVAKEGVATKTFVKTGIITDTSAEIIEGADSSTQVITSWSPSLVDGAPIQLK